MLLGEKIAVNDAIVGFASSGIHANGISLARLTAKSLPKGYQTKLPSGATFGEAILTPSYLYSSLMQDLFAQQINLHYAINITGHGWRKIMRASQPFCYEINYVPEPPEIFPFIQKQAKMSDSEMYATFNMGVGFVVFLPQKDVDKTIKIALKNKIKAWQLGTVKKAQKFPSVNIEPKKIKYEAADLRIRL